MEKFFKLKEHNTNTRTEVLAGITTFMTMAYILAVNPGILSASGMDFGAVFTATVLSSVIATLAMALLANYPFALAPGMGLNAFFAFTVAANYGWQMALVAVFIEGVLFLLLSAVNVREAIFNAIPKNLKHAVGVGIGMFIAFIGLKNAGIIIADPATAVALGDITSVSAILALVGTIVTVVFVAKKVRGALLWGILITYALGLFCEVAGIYVPNPEAGAYSLIPSAIVSLPPSISGYNILAAFSSISFSGVNIMDIVVVVFAFLFVDVFDTIGTLIGVSTKAGLLDKDGKLPKVKQALFADALGTTVGAALGTSTVTTYIESAAGVSDGGRTGLTSLVTAGCFFLALFFSPLFSVIPAFATAPALIVVGLFMLEAITRIDFKDYTESFPAFISIVIMPFTGSISDGIIFGILSYVALKLFTKKSKEINPVMVVVSILFVVYLIFA